MTKRLSNAAAMICGIKYLHNFLFLLLFAERTVDLGRQNKFKIKQTKYLGSMWGAGEGAGR